MGFIGNGDININLELSDFDEDEIIQETESPPKDYINEEALERAKSTEETIPAEQISQRSSPQPVLDPFEFQEDPIVFEPPSKPSGSIVKQDPHYVPHYHQQLHQSTTGAQQNGFEMEDGTEENNTKEQQNETNSNELKEESLDNEEPKESKVS